MKRRAWGAALVLGLLVLTGSPRRAEAEVAAVDEGAIEKAIERGVAGLRKMQRPDGTWPHDNIGATALAGVTLLECGAGADDKAVKAAAVAVRKQVPTLTSTYGLSLAILFLDRLDDPADTPLLESMTFRLLAGQVNGGWGYDCPNVPPGEVRRLTAIAAGKGMKGAELVGRRDLPKLPPKGERNAAHLSREVRDQLVLLSAGVAPGGLVPVSPDNSNTQFAAIALWIGRRYGLPVQQGLLRVDAAFRASQNPDGGWRYVGAGMPPPVMGRGGVLPPGFASTATMTCAGVIGLAVGHGGASDFLAKAGKGAKPKPRDLSKDAHLVRGLQRLETAVGQPTSAWKEKGPKPAPPGMSGKAYYFLWSLERVAVALDLKTIGKKDWYGWGSEALLANQGRDGCWRGEFGECGADTCFALLFLKRSNLTRDLTSRLRGLDERAMRAGLKDGPAVKDRPGKPLDTTGFGKKEPPDKERPVKGTEKPGGREETAGRMGKELVGASGERRAELLRKLRDGKGGDYTDALVSAIPKLEGATLRLARNALAERLARMTVATLRKYLKDEDAEVRRAAALASAVKEGGKALVPDLIRLLSDPETIVERAAHGALKELSGQDFGPAADAGRAERDRAIANWLAWWKKNARE